jgi:hypothetical protein
MVDLNLVVLCGRLSAPPEIREFEGGSRLARYLLTVRSEEPRRVDVLPVTLWDPPEALVDADPGGRVRAAEVLGRRRRAEESARGGRRANLPSRGPRRGLSGSARPNREELEALRLGGLFAR